MKAWKSKGRKVKKIKFISCVHKKELKKEGGYLYEMDGYSIDLCNECNHKLLSQMLSQMVLEHQMQPFCNEMEDILRTKLERRLSVLEARFEGRKK